MRVAVILAYLVLLIAGIPWYWPADTRAVLLGMPIWVAVSLGVAVLASVLTAWVLLGGDETDGDPP